MIGRGGFRPRAGRLTALALALAWCLGATPAPAAEKAVPTGAGQIELSYAPLVKRVVPSVVNIYARKKVGRTRSPIFEDPFFQRFFGDKFGFGRPNPRLENSLGSGVIVSADGLIVTNHHVIDGADEIVVALADRREFLAEVALADERTDLAVLRIDVGEEKLPALVLRDSDELEVGDLVLAIGNPFGVGQTVTSGIVSALARNGVGVADFQFFIQTDAAINPGNSGGPLVTMDGQIVGINTAIFSRSGGSIGIGFAIPSNMVASVIQGAISGGRVVRPWLGASGQALTPEIAATMEIERPVGVVITDIYGDGPAARAGLQAGDVIVAVDGRPVEDPPSLQYRIGTRLVGGTLELSFLRAGRRSTVVVNLVPAPEDPPRDVTELEGTHPIAGAVVGNLSPAFAEEIGANALLKGVVILKIMRGSPAHRMRLRPGDILLSVNDTDVGTVAKLRDILRVPSREWRIILRRGSQKINLVVRA